jgi:hypothetical protein
MTPFVSWIPAVFRHTHQNQIAFLPIGKRIFMPLKTLIYEAVMLKILYIFL